MPSAFARPRPRSHVHLLVRAPQQSPRHGLLVVLTLGVLHQAVENGHRRHQVVLVEQRLRVADADRRIVEAGLYERVRHPLEQQEVAPARAGA